MATVPMIGDTPMTGKAAWEEVKRLHHDLHALREEISTLRRAEIQAQQALQEAEEQLKVAEAELVVQISAETDPATSKPRYSNEAARAAELARRKAQDNTYLYAQQAARSARETYEMTRAQREQAERTYSDRRIVGLFSIQATRLIAGDVLMENLAGALNLGGVM